MPPTQDTRDALVQLILHTLESVIGAEEKGRFVLPCENNRGVAAFESTPLEVLVNLVANRVSNSLPQSPCSNAIISLNYDTLVDKAMRMTGALEPCYNVPEFDTSFHVPPRGRVPLLKLHGSANWRTCPTCKKSIALDLSERLSATHSCNCGQAMAPMLVPPSWDKGIHTNALHQVWESAFGELRLSRHWVFIGTSLPETDQYLKYLFAVALKYNDYLRHVVIVDPGDAPNVKRLFEHKAHRIRLTHFPFDMASALGHEQTSRLFRELGCFCHDKAQPYEW
jgi:hypothetical protein